MGIQIYQGMGSLSTCSNYQRPEIKLVSGDARIRNSSRQPCSRVPRIIPV